MKEASIFKPPTKPLPNRVNQDPNLDSNLIPRDRSQSFGQQVPSNTALAQSGSVDPSSLNRFSRKGDAFHSHSTPHIHLPPEAIGSGFSNSISGAFAQKGPGQQQGEGTTQRFNPSDSSQSQMTAQKSTSSTSNQGSLSVAEDLKMQTELDDFIRSLVQEQFEVEGGSSQPSPPKTSFFPILDQFLVPSVLEE